MALIAAVYPKFDEKVWASKTEIQQLGYLQNIPFVLKTIGRVNAAEMAGVLGMVRMGM